LARVKLESLDKAKVEAVKEADLSHHLSNGNAPKTKDAEPAKSNSKMPEAELDDKALDEKDMRDYPLHEALNLLKGIGILKK
jgi:carboxyl-terminal processing protease